MSWKSVRVFVCSTFADMHAERDFLVKRVFPDLQEWCAEREIKLVDIDLRWGITDEEATQGRNVIKRCLESIDASRPLFICFLGQRYGWVPSPKDVSQETYSAYPGLSEYIGHLSVTEIEILHAVISPLDERASRPRMRAFFYLREPSYLEQLKAESTYLRQIYTDEAEPDPEIRRIRLEALRKLKDEKINAAECSVRRYRVVWRDDEGVCTPEIALPLSSGSATEEQASQWRTTWMDVAGIEVQGTSIDPDSVEGLAAAEYNRQLTRGRLSDFVHDNQDGRQRPLSEIVVDDLKKAIQEEMPSRLPIQEHNYLAREQAQQEEFVFDAALGFIKRTDTFSEIDDYLRRPDDSRIFVLSGASGAGKSSLLASWVQRFESIVPPKPMLVYRFVGASDYSSSLSDLVRSVWLELNTRNAGVGEQVPEEPELMLRRFPALLASAALTSPLILLIDAVNQLQSGPVDLTWIPRPLPKNVKVIVSCPQWKPGLHEVVSMVRLFETEQDRRRLVEAYLGQYMKQLDDSAIRDLISFPGARNPLFLKVVLSELRVFGSFSGLHVRVRRAYGDDPVQAFDGVLRRLEADPAYSLIGPGFAVPFIFGLLAFTRSGLSRDELSDLLVRCVSGDQLGDLEGARDAVNLHLRQVRHFLVRRGRRFDFRYESFRKAALRRYDATTAPADSVSKSERDWHHLLANHYYQQRLTPKVSDPARSLVDVHLTFSFLRALPRRLLSVLLRRLARLLLRISGLEFLASIPRRIRRRPPVTASRQPTFMTEMLQSLISIPDLLTRILGTHPDEASRVIGPLFSLEQGACFVGRVPVEKARALAAAMAAGDVKVNLGPPQQEALEPWSTAEPHVFTEIIHHGLAAELFDMQVALLCDDAFRRHCVRHLGPKFFVDQIKGFAKHANETPELLPLMTELRMRIPMNEFTSQFVANSLNEGLNDVEQVADFLAACAPDPPQQARAIIALRSLEKPSIRLPRSERVRAQLSTSAEMLLRSPDKWVRWETVHAFWKLCPRADVEQLLRIATLNSEHPLIRAEAARQLGESNDARVLPILDGLASLNDFPLNAMASHSARRIRLSLRLVKPGPIEDYEQPSDLPGNLAATLHALGAQPTKEDLRRAAAGIPLLLHETLPTDISRESRWHELEILTKTLRTLPCRLVCAESGAGDCSLTPIKKIASADVWARVAYRYFNDFKIAAEEYLQLTTEYDVAIQGIDDIGIFAKAISRKREGRQALDATASPDRANAIVANSIRAIKERNARVALLVTQEIPSHQVARLFGVSSGMPLLDYMLPELTQRDDVAASEVVYLRLAEQRPSGDVFNIDVNQIHSF